ncbi:hypothetical protein MBLNU459_g3082t1 [Dothideomycetes sp. NU459]
MRLAWSRLSRLSRLSRPSRPLASAHSSARCFSSTASRREIRSIDGLADRIRPSYQETSHHDLLCLQWHQPPRNVLLVCKDGSAPVTDALIEYASHIQSTYPSVSLIFEPHVANAIHDQFSAPIYTTGVRGASAGARLPDKVDITSTLGGDGTILHASSLFATARSVPPILSFSMGTLGFLGEWKFAEYKRAFREVYMSGATAGYGSSLLEAEARSQDSASTDHSSALSGWSSVRGKSMGPSRSSRVLLRNRLKVGVYTADGVPITYRDPSAPSTASSSSGGGGGGGGAREDNEVYAMNEVLLHRGRHPHLSIINIYVGGRFLTESVADGLLISTPTGSTAYSLSSGGSIVHPLVSSLLLTPICPRSLSFRPLVLPANTPITLRLSEKNRGDEVEISVDGVRRDTGLARGIEVRVVGEDIRGHQREWGGGVPSIVRAGASGAAPDGQDHWVGGLNGLLKFNYPFGEDG